MSAYISIWIRANSGGPYICLDEWSRSHPMYSSLSELVPYETFKELSEEGLQQAMDSCDEAIQLQKEFLAKNAAAIEFLKDCAHVDATQLMEQYYDLKEEKEAIQKELDALEQTKSQLQFYLDILNEQAYSKAATLYVAHECDPNFENKTD